MTWSAHIFVVRGPSLPRSLLPPSVEPLPPAGAGDLASLRDEPPCTIVLIDGLFEARPAPWHKELIDLRARGFRLIGAASMGALRAAELTNHGMIGVGSVFRAYASGRLTADDEVAVLHAPAELDWRSVTDAMVEIRAALCSAVAARIVTRAEARVVRDVASAINFRSRTWASIRTAVLFEDMDPTALDRLTGWLPACHRSIKQLDALTAVSLALQLRDIPAAACPPPPLTSMLRRLLESAATYDYPNAAANSSRKNITSDLRRNG